MKHWSIKIIPLVLTVIVWKMIIDHSRDDYAKEQHGQSIYSPDKKNKAVVFSAAGGGGISPYCTNIISVVPAGTPDYIAYKFENVVYLADCHSIGIQHTKDSFYHVYAPIINWRSDKELEITFVKARVWKTHSADGKIQIVQEHYHE